MTDLEKQISNARLQAANERRNVRVIDEQLPAARRLIIRARHPELIRYSVTVLLEMRRLALENARAWERHSNTLTSCPN